MYVGSYDYVIITYLRLHILYRYAHRIVSKDSSSDGRNQVGVESPGYVLTSSDGGQTWVVRTDPGSRRWTCVTSSSDGGQIMVMALDSSIYTSTDFGNTFTRIDSSILNSEARNQIQWASVDSSSKGNFVVAAGSPGYVYISTDLGNSWSRKDSIGKRSWRSVQCQDPNCKTILATAYDNIICTSLNYGSTWKC